MNVAVVSGSEGWHVRQLRRALEERGARVRRVPVQALVARVGAAPRLSSADEALDDMDAAVVRVLPRGSLDQMIFRVDALHLLGRAGVRVVNSARAVERTVNKHFASGLLDQAGLPTPRTVVAERREDAMEAFRDLGDVVLKPLFGSNGRGMVRIREEEVAHRVFRALERERAVYYVQETVPHGGRDVRAFVVGDRVVAAAERRAEGWRTNVARGGTMRAFDLPADWEEMALRAAAAVGVEYGGVDLLPARSGEVFVTEVNGIPGWKGLQGTVEIDVAGTVADRVLEGAGAAGPREGGREVSDEASDGGGDSGGDEASSPAERFRRRIAELEDRLESTDDDAEREALRRDVEHLRAGLRAVERSGDGG